MYNGLRIQFCPPHTDSDHGAGQSQFYRDGVVRRSIDTSAHILPSEPVDIENDEGITFPRWVHTAHENFQLSLPLDKLLANDIYEMQNKDALERSFLNSMKNYMKTSKPLPDLPILINDSTDILIAQALSKDIKNQIVEDVDRDLNSSFELGRILKKKKIPISPPRSNSSSPQKVSITPSEGWLSNIDQGAEDNIENDDTQIISLVLEEESYSGFSPPSELQEHIYDATIYTDHHGSNRPSVYVAEEGEDALDHFTKVSHNPDATNSMVPIPLTSIKEASNQPTKGRYLETLRKVDTMIHKNTMKTRDTLEGASVDDVPASTVAKTFMLPPAGVRKMARPAHTGTAWNLSNLFLRDEPKLLSNLPSGHAIHHANDCHKRKPSPATEDKTPIVYEKKVISSEPTFETGAIVDVTMSLDELIRKRKRDMASQGIFPQDVGPGKNEQFTGCLGDNLLSTFLLNQGKNSRKRIKHPPDHPHSSSTLTTYPNHDNATSRYFSATPDPQSRVSNSANSADNENRALPRKTTANIARPQGNTFQLRKAPKADKSEESLGYIVSYTLGPKLIHGLESAFPSSRFIDRDLPLLAKRETDTSANLSENCCAEADVVISPLTGLLLMSLSKLRQRTLPGLQGSANTEWLRVEESNKVFDKLVVLVTYDLATLEDHKGGNQESQAIRTTLSLKNKADKEGSQSGHEEPIRVSSSDMESYRSFVAHVKKINMANQVRLIYNRQDEIIQWMAFEMIQRRHETRVVQKYLSPKETNWEKTLRMVGLNILAAQSIIGVSKENYQGEGLRQFLAMTPENRIRQFHRYTGRRVLQLVNAKLKKL